MRVCELGEKVNHILLCTHHLLGVCYDGSHSSIRVIILLYGSKEKHCIKKLANTVTQKGGGGGGG